MLNWIAGNFHFHFHKMDLALNNVQGLICHKNQPTNHSWKLYIYIYNWPIGLMISMFTNDLGDQGSIPVWVRPKTLKMVLNVSLLNTQHYQVWIKAKWINPRKRIVSFSTLQCSSYRKESLQVALNYGWTTYLYIYIYREREEREREREREDIDPKHLSWNTHSFRLQTYIKISR